MRERRCSAPRAGRRYATANNSPYQPFDGEAATTDYPAADPEKAELEAFAAAVTGEMPFPVTVDDAVHGVAVLEAIDRAAKTGQAVKI